MSTAGAFLPATRVTGVDGCRDGWVGVDLDDGGSVTVRAAASLDELLAGTEAQQVVGVDMPLGLLASGWRAADRGARALLGPRRSSIFAIPPAPVWQAPTYGAANQLCRDLTGNGFSAQAWGLRRKLLETAEYRLRCPHPLCEVHPELSFRMMAGAPLEHPKHAAAGRAQRRALLAGEGIVMPGDEALGRIAVDVLDAAAAAWSARRIAAGHACVLPDPPQTDPTGRDIAIRY
jgi:predicted RNase H-like nuclease